MMFVGRTVLNTLDMMDFTNGDDDENDDSDEEDIVKKKKLFFQGNGAEIKKEIKNLMRNPGTYYNPHVDVSFKKLWVEIIGKM
jgi:hypothetical protein